MLSENRVKARPVGFGMGVLQPFRWASKTDWYTVSNYDGPTFLIVPPEKSDDGLYGLQPVLLEQMYGKPMKTLFYNGHVIYVWPYNIMPTTLNSVVPSEKTPHRTGSFELSSEGRLMHASEGDIGELLFGNYWSLDEGEYRADFHLKLTGSPSDESTQIGVYEIDMATQRYTARLTKKLAPEAACRWREYALKFRAKKDRLYEFRVSTTGASDVKVRAVTFDRNY